MHMAVAVLLLYALLGCAGQSTQAGKLLAAPAGAKPAVAEQFTKGKASFASRDYTAAEQAFRQAIAADATSAESHYNLAVTLDRAGNQAEAKKHYIDAANLAPGNKVIWDSPPLRGHAGGLNHDINRKSYMDPSNRGF